MVLIHWEDPAAAERVGRAGTAGMTGRSHQHEELERRAKRGARAVAVAAAAERAAVVQRARATAWHPDPARGAVSAPDARLLALVEAASDLLLLSDAEERITFWSPGAAAALGWSGEEALGRTLAELVHPEDVGRVVPARVAAGAPPPRFTARFRHSDGSWRVLEGASRDLLGDPGVRAIVTSARDVTEQRALEAQLRGTQRLEAVAALAGGVAHDFNNVLAVIAGYAENAIRELDETDPLWSDMREVLDAGRRGAVLSRQLLAFTRRQRAEPVVLSPNAVLRELEKMLRRVIGEHLALEVRLAPDCGRVVADPAQVEQVLMNLVVNAREAISGPGTLTLETRNAEVDAAHAARHPGAHPGPHVVLSVADTGSGMDPEALAHLFEPFFTTKPAGKGTGLGLSVVHEIVRERGGHVEVETEAGRGTRVSVYLPRTEAEEEPPVRGDAALAFASGHGAILVVEDDEPLRAVTVRTLTRAGYLVLAAASGEQALEVARRHAGRLDLLVSDVVMPGLGGPEVARRLHAIHPEASILFTSGYVDDPAALRDALVSRANFLAKPYTLGALVRKAWEVVSAGHAGTVTGPALEARPAP